VERREGRRVGGHGVVGEVARIIVPSQRPCSAISWCRRRRRSSVISSSLAIVQSRRVWRISRKPPYRDRVQMCVNPRKSKVPGLPSPRAARAVAARRPNSMRRVLSRCSSRANSAIRFRSSARSDDERCRHVGARLCCTNRRRFIRRVLDAGAGPVPATRIRQAGPRTAPRIARSARSCSTRARRTRACHQLSASR
jgi:hypothetical protein